MSANANSKRQAIVVQAPRLQPPRLEFTNPRETPFAAMRSRGELPHLFKEGCTYFVTFRLADAVLPGSRVKDPVQRKEYLRAADSYDPPLTKGRCTLRRPEIARVVQDALLHFNGDRYILSSWCIMPNHVHATLTPVTQTLTQIMHTWKSFTAKAALKITNSQPPFWERESFDHCVRTVEDWQKFIVYVEQNPVVAGLCTRADEWPFGSAAYRARTVAGGTPAPQFGARGRVKAN